MKVGTKEFQDVRAQFEKSVNDIDQFRARLDRDKSGTVGQFYQDGTANVMFIAFMHGYQYAKSLHNIDAL